MAQFTITQTPNSRFAYFYPVADGCGISWYPMGDSPNYACLDDEYNSLTPDDDYVYMDGASVVSDVYEMENHGDLTGTINYVKGCCRARSRTFPPAATSVYRIVLSEDNTCDDFAVSSNMPVATGFTTFEYAWSENPFTSGEWEWDAIDNLQLGFEASSPSVIVSPFAILPREDGDRTDISGVTTGYEHWDAVRADRPLTQVYEIGAAWSYDLYEFIGYTAPSVITTYGTVTRGFLVNNGFSFSCGQGNGLYIHQWDSETRRWKFISRTTPAGGDFPQEICTDGTYYYVVSSAHIFAYTFDETTYTLTEVASIACTAQVHIQYMNGYIFTSKHNTNNEVSVYSFNGTAFSLIVTDTAALSNVDDLCTDGTYLYVADWNGGLCVVSFDGSNLTIVDSDNTFWGSIMFTITANDGYIIGSMGAAGIAAYTFNGTTLTLVDSVVEAIPNYAAFSSYYKDGYVFSTYYTAGTYRLGAHPFDGITISNLSTSILTDGYGNWDITVYEGVIMFTSVYGVAAYAFNGSSFSFLSTYAVDDTPKYLDDNIASVSVIAKMGKEYDSGDEADIRGCFIIKTGGSEFNTSATYIKLEYPYKLYAHTWTTNPNTGNPWTLAEVSLLQAGIGLYGDDTHYAACSICHLVIATTTNVSPEIQTSQCYLKVNYSPDPVTCTLNKPTEISLDHARNTQMLNFWSGNREVYDESRSHKTLVLQGKELVNGCDVIECVRAMGENGAVVTVARTVGWGTGLIDLNYRIKSFGWKHISEKPDVWEWILEFEASE